MKEGVEVSRDPSSTCASAPRGSNTARAIIIIVVVVIVIIIIIIVIIATTTTTIVRTVASLEHQVRA